MADKDTIQMIRKDITERLRDRDNHDCIEAANEIERLRKELDTRISMCDMRSEKIIELTNERDEARLQTGRILNEIDCRIEHGADSNGHLEAIYNLFKEATDER